MLKPFLGSEVSIIVDSLPAKCLLLTKPSLSAYLDHLFKVFSLTG
jgi:hypothetical protein